jgi:hypothetical protein
MATKRRRTRAELDERLRIVLERIPAGVDDDGAQPKPAQPKPAATRTGTESGEWRIVSGTINGSAPPGADSNSIKGQARS